MGVSPRPFCKKAWFRTWFRVVPQRACGHTLWNCIDLSQIQRGSARGSGTTACPSPRPFSKIARASAPLFGSVADPLPTVAESRSPSAASVRLHLRFRNLDTRGAQACLHTHMRPRCLPRAHCDLLSPFGARSALPRRSGPKRLGHERCGVALVSAESERVGEEARGARETHGARGAPGANGAREARGALKSRAERATRGSRAGFTGHAERAIPMSPKNETNYFLGLTIRPAREIKKV